MAMSVALAQTNPATFGQPTNYVATVTNSSGANVNLNSLQPIVSTPSGQLVTGVQIGVPAPSAQTSIAQSGGYQFNVVIPANSSVTFGFQIQFVAHPFASGTPVQPGNNFVVSVNCYSSDGSSFSAQAPITPLELPVFGPPQSMGSPSNQWPGSMPAFGTGQPTAPGAPGTLAFQNPFNAALAH